MSRQKKNTLKVSLADDATDQARIDTMQNITSMMRPQSALYNQNTKVKAAVDDAGQNATALKTLVTTSNNLKLQYDESVQQVITTRTKLGVSRELLRSTLQSNATSLGDLASLGLTGYFGAPPPVPLTPPSGVKVSLGKTHGQFRATAISPLKGSFGAQISADPIGAAIWTDLVGSGKRRLITGHASGALVWVRFRVVRGHTTSDWSAPVSVTVP